MLILVREKKKNPNVGLSKIRKFVKDITSDWINDIEFARKRYIEDILSDSKFLKTKKLLKI